MDAPTQRPQRAPHRQRRGLARMELILDAATRVIEERGYERMTTNAVAAEAGISPGSLYQYFSSRQDIASALWGRWSVKVQAIVEDDALTLPETSLGEVVDRVVTPLHALKTSDRVFAELYARVSAADPGLVDQADDQLHERLVAILSTRNPQMGRREISTATSIVEGMFSAIVTRATLTGDPGTDLIEMKRAIVAYLEARGIH